MSLCKAYFCELPESMHQENVTLILFKTLPRTMINQQLTICPSNHLVHRFSSCDEKSVCYLPNNLHQCEIHQQRDSKRNFQKPQVIHGTETDRMKHRNNIENNNFVDLFQCDDREEFIPFTLVCDFRMNCQNEADEIFCIHPKSINGFR